MKDRLFDLFMPILPKNDLSHTVGKLVHKPLPGPLARASVEWFAKRYDINMDEAERPISSYKTIGDLFTRKLKPGVRPLGQGILHPADSAITEAGIIEHQTLIQAKGKTYTVSELIRSPHFSANFEGGSFLTYYLCPTDYHRVHSPVDGRIIWSCHVPGELWPVNPWSVKKIKGLFAVNERIVIMIETPRGKAALVLVAATNVGNMTTSFDPELNSSFRTGIRQVRERSYSPPIPIQRGAEVGVFHMGSTVIMLYEKGMLSAEPESFKGHHVKMGQALV
jgi:phosphatidylserine decarboxylase